MPTNPVTPMIENTTMQAYVNNAGVLRGYFIYPKEGYALHVKDFDFPVVDEETLEETGEIKQGFVPYPSYTSVPHNYDWDKNSSELFTIPIDEGRLF